VEAWMTAGANPAAANDGAGGNEGVSGIWRACSAVLVPGLYGVLALIGSWYSPAESSTFFTELVCGLALVAWAVFIQTRNARVGNRQDYFGGLALVAVGLFALWASKDLPGMHGFAFGPGTAPRGFAFILGALGVGLAVSGFITPGPIVERFGIRGPILITASIFVFAASIRPLGLVITCFLSIFVSAFATNEVRPLEAFIWSIVLTIFCCLLFPWGLNLPMQLWPGNFDPMTFLHLR
jgi:putative tricarboxylic transport membrane protein